MRALLKRFPVVVSTVRAVRQLPGAARLRHTYAELFPARVFTTIYRENQWADGDSRSGEGSNLVATAAIRSALPGLLRECGVRSMLDVPCGDFHWMSTLDMTGIDYTGGDIVPDLIAETAARYGAPGRRFVVLDASRDPVPRVDLILCRDLFIHLSLARIHRTLANFRASGSTWLAASTYAECPENVDVRTGGYREVNLQAAPFHFHAPTHLLCEEPGTGRTGKWFGLWRLADVALDAAHGL